MTPTEEQIAATLEAVKKVEHPKRGAAWDAVLNALPGVPTEAVEEALNLLMDRGQIYEPTLGILKVLT